MILPNLFPKQFIWYQSPLYPTAGVCYRTKALRRLWDFPHQTWTRNQHQFKPQTNKVRNTSNDWSENPRKCLLEATSQFPCCELNWALGRYNWIPGKINLEKIFWNRTWNPVKTVWTAMEATWPTSLSKRTKSAANGKEKICLQWLKDHERERRYNLYCKFSHRNTLRHNHAEKRRLYNLNEVVREVSSHFPYPTGWISYPSDRTCTSKRLNPWGVFFSFQKGIKVQYVKCEIFKIFATNY